MVANGGMGLAEAHDGENHCGEHCPFLNRSDRRCSDKLCLDHISHAFDYCFGDYKACPVYLEQLAERRVRRLCGMLTPPADTDATRSTPRTPGRPLVQLTLGRQLHPAATDPAAHAHAHR